MADPPGPADPQLESALRDIELACEGGGLRIVVRSEFRFRALPPGLELRGPRGLAPSAVYLDSRPLRRGNSGGSSWWDVADLPGGGGAALRVTAAGAQGGCTVGITTEAFFQEGALPECASQGPHGAVLWRGVAGSAAHATFSVGPELPAPCRTRMCAHKEHHPVLLSAGRRVAAGALGNGLHFAVWYSESALPWDVLCFAAGRLTPTRFQRPGGRFGGGMVSWRAWKESVCEDSDDEDTVAQALGDGGGGLHNCVVFGEEVFTVGLEDEGAPEQECTDEVEAFEPESGEEEGFLRSAPRDQAHAAQPEQRGGEAEKMCEERAERAQIGSGDDYVSSGDEAEEEEPCFYQVRELPMCPVPGSTGL